MLMPGALACIDRKSPSSMTIYSTRGRESSFANVLVERKSILGSSLDSCLDVGTGVVAELFSLWLETNTVANALSTEQRSSSKQVLLSEVRRLDAS